MEEAKFMWRSLGSAADWLETPAEITQCREQFHSLQAIPTAQGAPYEYRCYACRYKYLAHVPGMTKRK